MVDLEIDGQERVGLTMSDNSKLRCKQVFYDRILEKLIKTQH